MTLKPVVAAAVLAASLAASAAQAATTILAKTGGWEAFGGTTSKGLPVCGVSTSPTNRYFGLKLFSGKPTFTIQISDKTWTVNDKATYGVTMRLDQNHLWTASATGMHFDDGDPGLEFTIATGELARFNQEFGSSKILRLQFTNGMADWMIDLAAAHEVNRKFEECNAKLK
jgi:hypothetical protein